MAHKLSLQVERLQDDRLVDQSAPKVLFTTVSATLALVEVRLGPVAETPGSMPQR